MIGVTLLNELALAIVGGFVGYKIGVNKEKVANKTRNTLHKLFNSKKDTQC